MSCFSKYLSDESHNCKMCRVRRSCYRESNKKNITNCPNCFTKLINMHCPKCKSKRRISSYRESNKKILR